ncbi:MAG: hypothetical protein IPN88_11350 [Bacteroidetes bacterium]|nr:hypothetical protein [Bacteroidota bacterium]
MKSKLNFGGSFRYLNIPEKENHFVAFIDLKTIKEKMRKENFLVSQVVTLFNQQNSTTLHLIGFHQMEQKVMVSTTNICGI